jgi:heme o synthase
MTTVTSAITQPSSSTVRDFITLLKPGVMSLVVFTGLAGMLLAPGHINLFQQFLTLLCISLASGAGERR